MNQRDEYRDNERFERDRESNGGRNWQGFDDSRDRGYEAQGRERDWDRWRGSGTEGRPGPRDESRWQWGRGGGGWEPGRRGQGSYGRSQGYDWGRDRHTHWQEPFARPEDTHYYGTGAAGFGGPGYTGGAASYGSGRRDLGHEFEAEYSDESAVYPHQAHQARRRFARGPKGYQRSDERIKEDISERLMESYHIDSSDVTVDVKGGVVTLDGTVPQRYMRHAIENVADNCLGVQDIDNRIRVKSQLEQTQSQTSGVGGAPNATSTATKTRQ